MRATLVLFFMIINREQKYTSYLGLDVWIGTWNVNGKKINEDITPWLCAGGANHVFVAE